MPVLKFSCRIPIKVASQSLPRTRDSEDATMTWTSPVTMMLVKVVGYAAISMILGYASYRGVMNGGVALSRSARIEYTASQHPYIFWSAIGFSSALSLGYGMAGVLVGYGLFTTRRAKQDDQVRP